MRLVYVNEKGKLSLTKDLREPFPPYAILSHTWGADDEEVVFQDMQDDIWQKKTGRVKLDFCANQARKDGLNHFWIDTCCINKANQSELQEAITSMFRWYATAEKCYAYLADIRYHKRSSDGSYEPWKSAFRGSRWFTRGWTLQELLAPKQVEFYSCEGEYLGNKKSLEDQINEVTCIPIDALRGTPLSVFSVEERLGWAARRSTTKEEDRAYCLSGICGVYMLPIYGEGQHAFDRLKDAIAVAYRNSLFREQPVAPSGSVVASRLKAFEPSAMLEDDLQTQRKRREELLQSLDFDENDARRATISGEDPGTCAWLLQHPDYILWSDPSNMDEHHGFLWIKGHPGAGKSTLMKFAYAVAERKKTESDIVVSFFFNARGVDLERSTLGMYRSLLFQLLSQATDLQHVLDAAPIKPWTLATLTGLFLSATRELGSRRLRCFVDALDECDELEIRAMVDFFEGLGSQVVPSDASLHICLASRHYPTIKVQHGRELILDREHGHYEDIAEYIRCHLEVGTGKQSDDIREKIQAKANGVFLWAVVVIAIVNEEFRWGSIFRAQTRLQEIPPQLSDLFKNILGRDKTKIADLLLALQWILFAVRPLTREEFYFAMAAGLSPEPAKIGPWDPEEVTQDVMNRFVINSSKGLAGMTKSRNPTVQFIHESVRDYLLKENGLSELWPEFGSNLHSLSHDQLKSCCANYLLTDISTYVMDDQELPKASSDARKLLRKTITDMFPFFKYATEYIWRHAEEAVSPVTTQGEFLSSFHLDKWLLVSNILEAYDRRHTASASLMYILAENNCPKLIHLLPRNRETADDKAERYNYPILAAMAKGHRDTVRALLKRTKDNLHENRPALGCDNGNVAVIRVTDREGSTALHWASSRGWDKEVQTLLDLGADVNAQGGYHRSALQAASVCGDERVVQILLSAGADVNAQGGYHGSALQAASACGNEKVVQHLLSAGADINAQGGLYGSALQAASACGNKKVVQTLLLAGADINAQGGRYGSALQAASARGNEKVVQHLLSAGADVNAQGGRYGSALQAASACGNEKVVQHLLSAGADVNAQGGLYGGALQAASFPGHEKVMQILLSAGADVNAQGGRYGSALQAASVCGDERVVQILLSAGADVNAQGGYHGSALQAASACGNEKVVQHLLSAGADINAQGGLYGGALQAASFHGHEKVMQILLSAGADVNAQGGLYGGALHAASVYGNEKVVQILLKAGADVNARGGHHDSDLRVAAADDHKNIEVLLNAAGAE